MYCSRQKAQTSADGGSKTGAAKCSTENSTETVISSDNESMLRRVIIHDGVEREYFVHVPNGAGTQLPVVVAIHGYTSTATGFEVAHSLNPHADANSYIVVYPQGSHFVVDGDTPYRVTSWNDLAANMPPKPEGPHCVEGADEYPCPPDCETCNRCAWTSCADDLGFIEKMLNAVQAEFNADTERTARFRGHLDGDRFGAAGTIRGVARRYGPDRIRQTALDRPDDPAAPGGAAREQL